MTRQNWEKCLPIGKALLNQNGLSDWRIIVENLQNALYTRDDSKGLWGYCDFGTEYGIDSETEARIRSGLPVPRIELLGEGRALFGGKTIRLDYSLHRGQFRQVLFHEMAHALRGKPEPGQGHNRRWAETAMRLGCTWFHVHHHWSPLEPTGPFKEHDPALIFMDAKWYLEKYMEKQIHPSGKML